MIDTIEELLKLYPPPTHLRMDNGPELIAHVLQKWCIGSGTGTAYIPPGSPWDNPFVESSMAALGMNSLISSYLSRCKKQSCWQSNTGSSTIFTDCIRLSKGVRPWMFSSNGRRPDHPSALIRTGAAKGDTTQIRGKSLAVLTILITSLRLTTQLKQPPIHKIANLVN